MEVTCNTIQIRVQVFAMVDWGAESRNPCSHAEQSCIAKSGAARLALGPCQSNYSTYVIVESPARRIRRTSVQGTGPNRGTIHGPCTKLTKCRFCFTLLSSHSGQIFACSERSL